MKKLTEREKEIVILTILATQNFWIKHLNKEHKKNLVSMFKQAADYTMTTASQLYDKILESTYLEEVEKIKKEIAESKLKKSNNKKI